MELSETVHCPFCGQRIELVVDTSAGSHEFTTDCEVCCRPIQVRVQCQPGEIQSLDIVTE
jgi:transcription elongation factor Elf1